jgi:membrane protein DedA with SNARE-associated domain
MTRDGNGPERSAFRSAFFTLDFSIVSIFALAVLACVLGNTLGYVLERRGVCRPLLKAHISDTRMQKVELFFAGALKYLAFHHMVAKRHARGIAL